jgi:hypothetical protein
MERLSSVSGQIQPTSHRVMHRRPTTYSQLKDVTIDGIGPTQRQNESASKPL